LRCWNAPRGLVFEAFTDPKHVDHWYGPRGFTTHTSDMDLTFEETSGKTKVTKHSVFPSVAEFERVKGFGAVEGGKQTLESLAEWLAARGA